MNKKEDSYIECITTQNKDGLISIYEQFLPRIKNLIKNNGGSEDDAMDIFQDAILIIFEKIQEKLLVES